MLTSNEEKIKKILGELDHKSKPTIIFDRLIINFFNEIYINLKDYKPARSFSDLMTFVFWCRKKNIEKLSKNYSTKLLVIGRGKVLHIAPSNVPMNFAYSFAFGMLSGNYNIVRLPSKNFIQINILCNTISKICSKKKYKNLLSKFLFIKYENSDVISKYLSQDVDARMIWGGDKTIKKFRSYDVPPRCVDLNFADRYSISLIKISALTKLNEKNFSILIKNFYNDCYLMDQQGCSSPRTIIWISDENKINDEKQSFIKKFWIKLDEYVKSNYSSDLSITNKKVNLLAFYSVESKIKFKTSLNNINVIRIQLPHLSDEIEKINCSFGTFCEIRIKEISEIKKLISKKYQTATYFGFDSMELKKAILVNGILGIDRIVPIGRAHYIGPLWDGYDIIYSLARIISN